MFADCIKSATEQGELTPQEAKRLEGLYESFRKQHAKNNPGLADAAAKEALAKLISAETIEKKRQAILTLKVTKRIAGELQVFRTRNKADVGEAAIHLLENQGGAPYQSVEGLKGAIIGQAHMRMSALLREFRRSAIGGDWARHGQARLANVVREAFHQGSGDEAAKGLAEAWSKTAEWLRQRYNAAGGHIAELDNWGLPQMHDPRALRRSGMQQWKQAIVPKLDLARMIHPLTEQPLRPEDLDELLTHIYKSITQEGWNTRQATRQPFGIGALANQNAEHRVLVFKSSDDWLAYQKDFGEGDAFAAMMGHVSMMARDIATMEILGPNPNATAEWLKQVIEKEGQKAAGGEAALLPHQGEKGLDYARGRIDKFDRMYQAIRGELETPVNSKWAETFAGVRNIITSSVMGGAALSSVTDLGTQILARNFNNIGQGQMLSDYVRGFTVDGRQMANEAGLITEAALHTFHRQARYVGSFSGPEWSRYVTDRVLTWSGLSPWTQAGRHAFGLATMREMAAHAGREIADLPPPFRNMLERWGFTAKDWNALRSAKIDDGSGLRMLRVREVADVNQRLADRYLEMINAETDYAVPTGNARERTFLIGRDPGGTLWGELTRSAAQFKSYGVTFMFLNGMRYLPMIASQDGAVRARGARYAGALLLSTTFFGALAIQLKQVAGGRDPRNMNDRRFWGAAMLQGGGIGLFGDFLFSDINRFGGGLPTTLAGPTVQHLWDLWTLTGGNAVELVQGKDTNAGRELTRFLAGNTPGGSIWFARLAYERLFLDQLQYLVDPKANKAFKAKQQWWKRETGQEFFWQPGDTRPDRAPDFSAAWQ